MGRGGGPLVPGVAPRRPPGGGLVVPAPGVRTLPPPLSTLREPDPRAGPRWGPLLPSPSSRGAGWLGAAVNVSGQGCGVVGSPPRSLSLPSLPWEVARAPPSRRIVGGAWVGGPGSARGGRPTALSPPHSLAPIVWDVTCAAACVGAGAVALAGFAGGSASG